MGNWCRAVARVIALLALCSAVVACGGGGGGGSSPVNPGASSVDIVGRASVLGGAGAPENAPGGLIVQLRALAADGSIGAPTATTTTGADGRFSLRTMQAAALGIQAVVEVIEGSRVLRGFAQGAWVEVSPASEAVFQEVSAAVRQRGALPSESPSRFARFVVAATQFLHLTDVHANNLGSAVSEMRAWLTVDPASRVALDSLRASGMLPPTLGDLGGMHGLGRAASVSTDTAGQVYQVAMRYRADNGGEFDVWKSSPNDAFQWLTGSPDMVLRMNGDGVEVKSSIDALLPLDHYFGGVRIARFGVPEGGGESMAVVSGKTAGVSYDSDRVEDDFQYTSMLRNVGYEAITHDAQSTRTLHLQRVDRVVVSLSAGGITPVRADHGHMARSVWRRP